MNMADMFPSKWLGQADLPDGPRVVTIDSVEMVTIKDGDNDKRKPKVSFRERDVKPWLLNVGCTELLLHAFGDTESWAGKRVELYVNPDVMMGGKRTGGVRVRIPIGGQAAPAAPAPPAPRPLPPKPPIPHAGTVPTDTATQAQAWNAFLDTHPELTEEEGNRVWFALLSKTIPGKTPDEFSGKDWSTVMWALPTKGDPF